MLMLMLMLRREESVPRETTTRSMPRSPSPPDSDSATVLDSTESDSLPAPGGPPAAPHGHAPSRIAALGAHVQALNALLFSLITLFLLSIVALVLASVFLSFAIRTAFGSVRNLIHWNPYVLGSSGHLLGELVGEFTYAFWAGWGVWMD